MIDKNKKYRTRDGREVIIYAIYEDQVHGAINSSGRWIANSWLNDGKSTYWRKEIQYDLVEVKPTVKYEKWFLFNQDGSYSVWNSKEDALKHTRGYINLSKDFALKKVSFEYEMGEGL